MKKSISLIEVLISVMLVAIVIGIIIQIQNRSLFFFDKYKNSNDLISYLVASSLYIPPKFDRNKNIYLYDMIKFKNDDFRKKIKEIKINVKDEKIKSIKKEFEDYLLNINVYESKYSFEDQLSKKLFFIKFEE
jgi:Tfp pilus assembly protein PilV